jgi:hypothetical protein
MKQATSKAGFLLGLFFYPEDGSDMILRKSAECLRLHGVGLYPRQKNSSVTAVKTSNPTLLLLLLFQ